MLCSLFIISFLHCFFFFFFKQKTAYEMRISDWSSDVCSSDLRFLERRHQLGTHLGRPTVEGGLRRRAERLEFFGRRLVDLHAQIGRASCRERVCQYV